MMNPRKKSVILCLSCSLKRSVFLMRRDAKFLSRSTARFGLFGVWFTLIALAAGLFLSNFLAPRVFSYSGAMMISTESVSLFSSADLTTPKTVFNLGEKAWALDRGTQLPVAGIRQRRFQWVAPDGTVKQQNDITIDGQSDSYQISATAQVGTWLVKSVDNSNIGYAVASFVVRDPGNASADLSVQVFGQTQAAAGKNLTYTLTVTNNGPDDAQNVQLTDVASGGVNFQSLTEPPDWSCTGSSAINCSVASLARGATASFTIEYQVDADAPGDATISNTAEISSRTNEPHTPDNTSTSTATVITSTCGFACPENITQAHDAGLNGATVNYETPSISSGCDPVICTPPSGSFFPAGVTTVVCSSLTGGSCSFTVTVTGTLSITLDGPDPLVVECHTEFREPGATVKNDTGNTFPVTSSAQTTLDMNTPGNYTITYTATDGVSTVTATRAVEVVDTTPPVITLNGANPMIVDLRSVFTDPGATALDACGGSKPVTSSGAVDTNTTGIYQITYTATDGTNTATTVRKVIVPYVFTGFFPPIGNPPELNVVNAGRAIPVKFSLGGDKGLDIFELGFPAVVLLDCGSNQGSEVQETVTAGESTLNYDPAADQYIYVWKTDRAWEGTCRRLVIKLNDETVHIANFKFR